MTTAKKTPKTKKIAHSNSTAMTALPPANEPVRDEDAVTVPAILAAILDAWNDLQAVEQAMNDVIDQRVNYALLDPCGEARERFDAAVYAAKALTAEVANCCATCLRLSHVVTVVIRAYVCSKEVWDANPYRTAWEIPAERVLHDALFVARGVMEQEERRGNLMRPAV
jgi:hypothetical protein